MNGKLPLRVRLRNLKSRIYSRLLGRALVSQLRETVAARAFLLLGRLFEILSHLPLVGNALVRRLARSLGRMFFYSPGTGLARRDSLQEIKQDLVRAAGKLGLLTETSGEKPDRFELSLLSCPLGYYRFEHQGPCQAAQDLSRTLVRLCGGGLELQETIPSGAPRCRMTIRRGGK